MLTCLLIIEFEWTIFVILHMDKKENLAVTVLLGTKMQIVQKPDSWMGHRKGWTSGQRMFFPGVNITAIHVSVCILITLQHHKLIQSMSV